MNGKYLPYLLKDSREELLKRVSQLETSGAVPFKWMLYFSPTPLSTMTSRYLARCWVSWCVIGAGARSDLGLCSRQTTGASNSARLAGFKPWNIFHKICKYFSAICRCRMCRCFKTRTAPSSLPCWLMYPGGDGGGSICVYSALYSARQMSRSRPRDNLPH